MVFMYGDSDLRVDGYIDTNFQSDVDDRKSILNSYSLLMDAQ